MDGGFAIMDIARKRINSCELASIISLPVAYVDKEVEIVVRELPVLSSTPIADKFAGIAKNLNIKTGTIRSERLNYENFD